jgi:hypothetical protein
MSTPETNEYDRQLKRPLELRVRDMQDEGGISEEDASRLGRVAADALVIIRFLADENKGLAISLHSLNGKTHEPLSIEAQFMAWLSFTGYLAREAQGEDNHKRRHFLRHVLGLLALDEQLGIIQPPASADQESHCSQSDESASTSG